MTFLRYYLPVLLWAVVISVMSTSRFGSGFTERVLQTTLESIVPGVSPATLQIINAVVRKLAHIAEYLVLGWLLWRALAREAARRWQWGWVAWTLALAAAFAGFDELHQHFEPGRGASLVDVGFDTLGAALALGVLYWRARRAADTTLP
ncbi:MAG: VanZ family protein [Terriglobia bacterium]